MCSLLLVLILFALLVLVLVLVLILLLVLLHFLLHAHSPLPLVAQLVLLRMLNNFAEVVLVDRIFIQKFFSATAHYLTM